MFNFILKLSIRYRYLVVCLSLLFGLVGALSYNKLIIDAVPDITNIQVQINTEIKGYSPVEVEQRVTRPIELFLSGLPFLDYTRSLSRYGLSQVTVIFKDGTDIYFARQLISQRLQESKELLPAGTTPTMGPISTGLGEIFMYTISNSKTSASPKTLQELREIQDWVVKPQLRTVQGVVEVNSIGGAAKQIIITPDLAKLRAFELELNDIALAVMKNNTNRGAGFIEQSGEQFLIRVPAQVSNFQEIKDFVVAFKGGNAIQLGQVASIEIGSELRTGAATEDGEEIVLGTVFMLIGENGRDVSERVSSKIQEIAKTLPAGAEINAVYNRSHLINTVIETVKKNLFEGAILVVIILFLALGNIKAALITAMVIPLSMLITIFGMVQGRLSANLMSLGALDFGLIVDGAVILVENCIKRFSEAEKRLSRSITKEERLELVYLASSEVRQATMFGELIIMIVYVPILALTGIEGKMYHPMALTVILALSSAFILSLTFVPAAISIFITGNVGTHSNGLLRVENFYKNLLLRILKLPYLVISFASLIFFGSIILLTTLGSEFMPALDEGDIALHALRIPGTSLSQSIHMQHQLENRIKLIPEVSHVFAKIGTAEVATDPMPPSVADGYVILKDRSEWPDKKKPKLQVVSEIEEIVSNIPGNNYEFTQPIQMRFNELIAGVRSDLAVKVFGDDFEELLKNGKKIESIIKTISGAADVKIEQVTGLPTVTITPRREMLTRYHLDASDIQDTLEIAYSGKELSKFFEGDRNFPIILRLSEEDRSNVEKISDLKISLPKNDLSYISAYEVRKNEMNIETKGQSFVSIGEISDIDISNGPNQITRENGKRRVVVTANIRNRDLGSFVEEVQSKISSSLNLPAGYWVGYGGQYENLISAKSRLYFIVPIVLLSVFCLIMLTFRSLKYSILVFSGIPFALSGGIFALWFTDIPFSISAAVGFIALCGVSVLNALVLISFIRKLIEEQQDEYTNETAIIEGAVSRLRPVLMTALVASLGFIPMAISQGIGSEVQRPLATVVIGGVISSTILTLLVLPVLCKIFLIRKR